MVNALFGGHSWAISTSIQLPHLCRVMMPAQAFMDVDCRARSSRCPKEKLLPKKFSTRYKQSSLGKHVPNRSFYAKWWDYRYVFSRVHFSASATTSGLRSCKSKTLRALQKLQRLLIGCQIFLLFENDVLAFCICWKGLQPFARK